VVPSAQEPNRDGISTSAKPPKTLGDRIIKAGLAVLLAHACKLICGYLMQYFIVNKYQNGYVISDVFSAVYDVVLGTAFYVGEQCLEPAALPVFTQVMNREGEARAWRYASSIFNLQFIILVLTIGALYLWPTQIIGAFTQWDPPNVVVKTTDGRKIEGTLTAVDGEGYTLLVNEKETRVALADVSNAKELPTAKDLRDKIDRREMSRDMMPWVAPGLLGMSLASLTYMLLNGYKEFFFAAFGDAVLKLAIMAGAMVGAAISNMDWRFVAVGAVVGGVAKLVTHSVALGFRRLKHYRFVIDLKDPYVLEFFWLVLPLLAGILLSRFRDAIVFNVQTAKANLPTYFNLGKRLTDGISFVIPYTLSIAMLPFFCDISARDDRKQLGDVLTRIVRMLIWFFVPISIILAAAAMPVTLSLYAGDKFGAAEAGYVSLVLRFFCLQLPFLSIEMMVMQAFFSSRRTIAPTVIGFVFSMLAGIVPYVLMRRGYLGTTLEILVGLAVSLVAARVLKALVLIALLKRTVPVLPLTQSIGFLLRVGIAGFGSGLCAWAASHLVPPLALRILHTPRIANIASVIVISAAGAIVYLGVSLALRMEEPRQMLQWTKEKVKGQGKPPKPEAPGAT